MVFETSEKGESLKSSFFISVPHSGEKIPAETPWLLGLPEPVVMRDVDRYVDRLYREAAQEIHAPFLVADWHRYVVDLNRTPEDIDRDSVDGAPLPSGSHVTGFHWSQTTQGEVLMAQPMSQELHKSLTKKYFWPFHTKIQKQLDSFQVESGGPTYQLDAHSMPSVGTKAHRDPGQERPEIVVSDVDGTSCERRYLDLVVASYEEAGFQVAVNFPYKGGRMTQTYGKPAEDQHCIQVEMNRRLYMDEDTKRWLSNEAGIVARRVTKAVSAIYEGL